MSDAIRRSRTPLRWLLTALALAAPMGLLAQGPPGAVGGGQRRGGPPRGGAPVNASAKAAAPVDLTGWWVSQVTEDWIERMSPDSPPSGTGGARGLDALRPKPAPPGTPPCRAYAAGGSMRIPGRLHITWVDDNTLKIEMDAGSQTRLFHFNPEAPAPAEKSLQGYSVASWEFSNIPRGRGGRGGPGGPAAFGDRGAAPAAPPAWGSLNVVTTHLNGGYLLSLREPYSDNAALTEYFTKHTDFGVDYLTVTATLQDGARTRVTSSTFKREPNGEKFKPTGCEILR